MNIDLDMIISMEPSLHHSVDFRPDDYMDRLLGLDINNDVADHGRVEKLLPLLYESDKHHHSDDAIVKKHHHHNQPLEGHHVDIASKADRSVSPLIEPLTDVMLNHSAPSTASLESSASNITSITTELRKAAKKTIQHAKSKRKVMAAIPLCEKEAILEKEFPHVRNSSRNISNNNNNNGISSRVFGNDNRVSSRSVDSMIANRSVDSFLSTANFDPLTSLDQVLDERVLGHGEDDGGTQYHHDHDDDGDSRPVDYDDCVQTLTHAEMLHLRNAMYSYEKQRVMTMMENLSHQMQAFHEVLEENDALKTELGRVKKERDNEVSDLQKTLIDMKLTLAQCQSREDHTRLITGRLEMDLKKAHDENYRLLLQQQQQSTQSARIAPDDGEQSNIKVATPVAGKKNRRLVKSFSSAEQPPADYPRKNSRLVRSWFGNNHFLDKSIRMGEGNTNQVKNNEQSPTEERRGDRLPKSKPKKVAPPNATRSKSFVEPKKARAKKESEFMHWNSCEKSDDEGVAASLAKKHPLRSRSFLHPQEARKTADIHFEPLVGSDILLRHERMDAEASGSRNTFLSNITDITFEDGDTLAEEISKAQQRKGPPPSPLTPTKSSSNHPNRDRDDISGEESRTTLTFEPAGSQLQHVLGLRVAEKNLRVVADKQPREGKVVATDDEMLRAQMLVEGRRPGEQKHQMAKSMQLAVSLREQGEPGQHNTQPQKAASLRGRKSGRLSAGDAYLAFC